MCFSAPQAPITACHSAIERPYFRSIDGKYDAGPCLGHLVRSSGLICSSGLTVRLSRQA